MCDIEMNGHNVEYQQQQKLLQWCMHCFIQFNVKKVFHLNFLYDPFQS